MLKEKLIQSAIRDLQVALVKAAGQDTVEISRFVKSFEQTIRSAKQSDYATLLAQAKQQYGS